MANMTIEKPRNIMLKNCTIQFPKLNNAVNYQGKDQWELSLITESKEQAAEWMKMGIGNVKPNDPMNPTVWTVSLKRKVITSKGEENGEVRVVDADKKALSKTERGQIGNGSVANVILFQGPYDNEYGKGISNSLTAVQITHLEKYEGGLSDLDFDIEGEGANIEGAADGEIF